MHTSCQSLFPRSVRGASRIRYPLVVTLIERAISNGKLKRGQKLPTHRALAAQLGTSVGTVTRAYSEAERLGLIVGEVGRGTYVVNDSDIATSRGGGPRRFIDMTINRPPNEGAAQPFTNALRTLSKRRDLRDLLGIEPANGWLRHRAAAAKWIAGRGLILHPGQVIACNGVQHALSVTLAALTQPGDIVVTEDLNYPGITLLGSLHRLRLIGVTMDAAGLQVERLEEVCRRHAVRLVICSPTAHNPTTVTMSSERRTRLADAAKKYDFIIIENDILGMMPVQQIASLYALAPERSCYITGLTKVVAAGFRLAFIVSSSALLDRLTTAVRGTTWMPPPLMFEIFTLWVEKSVIEEVIAWHRNEILARLEIAKRHLPAGSYNFNESSYHIWLHVPEEITAAEFVNQAHAKGVSLLPGEAFTTHRDAAANNRVRISLGALNDRVSVRKGLSLIAAVMSDSHGAMEV